jgi:hypothetical protein
LFVYLFIPDRVVLLIVLFVDILIVLRRLKDKVGVERPRRHLDIQQVKFVNFALELQVLKKWLRCTL